MLFGLNLSTLCLKVGALIVLLQNLYLASEKYNETQLIITGLWKYNIKGQIRGDKYNS